MSFALTSNRQVARGQPPTTARPAAADELGPLRARNGPDSDAIVWFWPSAGAPSQARHRVRWVCAAHDLLDRVVRDAAFVAGELVAISVRQVHAPLILDITVEQDNVRIRIRDLGGGQFARSRPDVVGTDRSLQLVQCVAESWGVSETADGREMWAAVARRPRAD